MKRDYQVFISFKNSDDITQNDTLDKEIAYKVYKYLTDRGLNVFFSPVTLKALGRDSWSEEIDSALKQSKVFIAVGTQKEYMNAKWVKEERTKFFGLKLNDKSRAIYGYIASPMTLKNLPDDMGKLEVFQDKRPKELIRLYTYIRNHLAYIKQGDLESRKVNNKNYFWIGILIVLGVFFYNLNDDNGERLEDKKKIISAKESLIEVLKEERLEDKKIIKEKEEERKRDKELIAFLLTKFKDHPNYDEIVEESEKIEKLKGTKAVINYLRSIDLDDYQKRDVVEKVVEKVTTSNIVEPLKNIIIDNNISNTNDNLGEQISLDIFSKNNFSYPLFPLKNKYCISIEYINYSKESELNITSIYDNHLEIPIDGIKTESGILIQGIVKNICKDIANIQGLEFGFKYDISREVCSCVYGEKKDNEEYTFTWIVDTFIQSILVEAGLYQNDNFPIEDEIKKAQEDGALEYQTIVCRDEHSRLVPLPKEVTRCPFGNDNSLTSGPIIKIKSK